MAGAPHTPSPGGSASVATGACVLSAESDDAVHGVGGTLATGVLGAIPASLTEPKNVGVTKSMEACRASRARDKRRRACTQPSARQSDGDVTLAFNV